MWLKAAHGIEIESADGKTKSLVSVLQTRKEDIPFKKKLVIYFEFYFILFYKAGSY